MNAPSERDVKKLFALSLNQCAFPDCLSMIFSLKDEMVGEICHIKAQNKGGPRWDGSQTDAERHGFGNLILLCRNHHKIIDDNPAKYTVEWLHNVKRQHEENGGIELSQHDAQLAMHLLRAYVELNIQGDQNVTQVATGNAGNVTQVAGDYGPRSSSPVRRLCFFAWTVLIFGD